MLYAAELHQPLTETPWNENHVRDAIRAIAADADAAYDPDELWPAHEWDGWQAALPLKNLYVGAAGVVWALDDLRRRGLADTSLDLSGHVVRLGTQARPPARRRSAPPRPRQPRQ